MKNIFLTLGLLFNFLFLFSCMRQVTPQQILNEEIKENTKKIQYKNININDVSIQIPNNLNNEIENYLQHLIKKDSKIKYCNNDESKVEIKYIVTFATNKLFSIMKETQTMFCYPYDNIYYDFINLLLYNEHIYIIKIKDSNRIKKIINNYINTEDIDVDCEYNNGDYQINLTIEENKIYLFLEKDKVCFLKIPIDFEKDNFIIELLK